MIPKEIFEKVRHIQIQSSRVVTDVFAGQYHSVFKGLGIEFDEVREYQRGDDIRTIDWNVTARTGTVHVKKYIEERELTVMVVVDASSSSRYASTNELKNKLAAEIAAVLALAAIRNNDKVGLIIFTDRIEKFIPPRKGVRHVLRVIREVLYFTPTGIGTDIAGALEYLSKVTTRKTVTFVISDFFENTQNTDVGDEPVFAKALAIANRRHDIIAVTLNDPTEKQLPAVGLITLEDAETGDVSLVDTNNRALRVAYHKRALKRLEAREKLFRASGVDHIDISTDTPFVPEIVKFFRKRRKRR